MRKDMAFTIPYGHASTVHLAYITLRPPYGVGNRRLYACTAAVDDRCSESVKLAYALPDPDIVASYSSKPMGTMNDIA